jgi:hypothetical protein
LTNNSTDDYLGDISGINVVWHGYDGNDWEIYMATYVPVPGAVILGALGLAAVGVKLRKYA